MFKGKIQTGYYKDNYNLYYKDSRFKNIKKIIKQNTTVDLGGIVFGTIGLIFLII